MRQDVLVLPHSLPRAQRTQDIVLSPGEPVQLPPDTLRHLCMPVSLTAFTNMLNRHWFLVFPILGF